MTATPRYRAGDFFRPRAYRNAVLIVGVSGAGKSTLVNYLCGGMVARAAGGADAVTMEPQLFDCEQHEITLMDTRGDRDPNATSQSIMMNTLRWIRDNDLHIRLIIIIYSDGTERRVPDRQWLIDTLASLHPDMRSRMILWSTSDRARPGALEATYGLPAVRFPFDEQRPLGYDFSPADFAALLREPLNPVWTTNHCSHCHLRGDRRLLAAEPCLRHVKIQVPHRVDWRGGSRTERRAHLSSELFHPGHFRGLLYGFTWSCCGGKDDQPCQWRGCHCPRSSPGCQFIVNEIPGTRYCQSCSNVEAPFCYEVCATTGCQTRDFTTSGCVEPAGAAHHWST